jgi:hypothetical protein
VFLLVEVQAVEVLEVLQDPVVAMAEQILVAAEAEVLQVMETYTLAVQAVKV